MAVNLMETFGLVPHCIFPESFNSSATGKIDTLVTSKLREFALELRELHAAAMRTLADVEGNSCAAKKAIAVQNARKRKEEQMGEIYRVLAITLGAPPKPTDPFVWEYYSKDKKYHRVEATPLSFYKDVALVDVSRAISLIHDPRNKHGLYTVERLGNVWGARPVLYVNTDIGKLKETAIRLLKADIPVWFGSDVGKCSSSALGIMDTALYDLDEGFGTTLRMSKAQRLQTGDSSMTHAMVLTAVHIENGKPVRWRVENSWGADACDKVRLPFHHRCAPRSSGEHGADPLSTFSRFVPLPPPFVFFFSSAFLAEPQGYMLMSDEWFDQFVYQIVADRKYIDKALVDVFEHGEPTVLPPWDPMGSLA
ncbi:SPOSA6832_04741, partial [Sporobolomyces salmonicolor]